MTNVALAIAHIEASIKLLGEDLVTLIGPDKDDLCLPQYVLSQVVNSLAEANCILERVLV